MTKEELIQELNESAEAIEEYEGSYGYMFDAIADMVKDSDLVEVVRCKDCYYFGEPTYIKNYHVCSFYKTHIQDVDYCSKGIRYIKCDADK